MNLLIKRSVLLLFLISLFACDDSNDLGTSFEGSLINAVYTDTVKVTAATVLAPVDSIIGYKKGNLLAGTFTNDKFGVTTAKAYLEIGPSGGSFPANSTLDSVVLALDYNEYYGDTLQDYTLEVHELTKAFEVDKTYYTTNNNNLTYADALLGAVTFKPAPKRTIARQVKDAQGNNVTVKASIPLRIKLNNELGQRIMSLPTATLSSAAEFAKTFKGLVLTPGALTNAALGFAPDGALASADSTYLRIYYTADSKKQTYELPISGGATGNNRFNEISYNRSNTPLAVLQKTGDSLAAAVTGGETYLQESTGILTKITFPHLASLANSNIAMNRAELIIPVKENNSSVPAPLAYLVPTNQHNRILRTSDLNPRYIPEDPLIWRASSTSTGTPGPAVLRYDATKKAYVANVTQYIQSLIYNKPTITNFNYLTSKSLLLWPSSGSGILEANGLAQSVLQTDGADNIKLRIYFSRIN